MNIHKHFTGQRRLYPYIFGALFWIMWIGSSLLGPGNFDLGGQVVGTDYMMAYTSGLTLSDGEPAELFDYETQRELQTEILGEDQGAAFSLNLPMLQWIYVPFAQLPYLWSVLAWSIFGMGLLATSLRLLGKLSILPLALTFMPVYSNFTFGQNAFVSLVLLSAVYALWSRDRRFAAGLVLALLLYKPQLVTGVGLLWLLNARRDWKALGGFAVGGTAMAAFAFGVMPEATEAYIDFARNGLQDLAGIEEFPDWHMHNPRGFWELLVPVIADPLWILTALAGIAVFVKMWRARVETSDGLNRQFWFAAAVLLTLWATPHALIYDWTMLLIPAVLLWQARTDWHDQLTSLFIWGWLAYAVSLPLTLAQQSFSPIAIQVSVLFFAFALYTVTQMFFRTPVTAEANPVLTPTG